MERITRHYLMVWRKRAEGMTDTDKLFLRPMYENMKQLTEEERQFLMDKYFYPDKPLNDKQMAEQAGLTQRQYATKRRKIEKKMNVYR